MPLYKRTPFSLVESPRDLNPHVLVFQVRFTKEIFKDYQQYLNRINLYRQRVWTCKITGKTNLTYEEALVSEQRATEKVQQFPKELVGPVLHMVQYSPLKLADLVNDICRKLQERLLEGVELYVKKEQAVCPCRILKVLEGSDKLSYEVGWLDKDKKVTGSSVVNAEDLIRKKLPFSRAVLKSFIRESTSQSSPWIIHEKLSREYGISTELPEELQDSKKVRIKNTENQKNKMEGKQGEISKKKRKKVDNENSESLTITKKVKTEDEIPKEPIKYPIDDLLVEPGPDDPVFTDRPSPLRDFTVPMDCVGDLLLAWDFCTSFSKLLNLSPFSLEDFQNAICHKDNKVSLIVESCSAILRLLIKEEGKYFTGIEKKNRSGKITLVTWTNYLCDFLEMEDQQELSSCVATIKRGHYSLLDSQSKLGIFRELVNHALATNAVREQLDEYIEQQHALASTQREVAIEENRKKKEKKELQKVGSDTNDVAEERKLENGGGKVQTVENGDHKEQNGHNPKGKKGVVTLHKKKNISGNRESKNDDMPSKKVALKENMAENDNDLSGNGELIKAPKRVKDKEKEIHEKNNKANTKAHLEREIEKRFVRTSPLGKDRNYNRYWFFGRDGRIFVESPDSNLWGYYSFKEELDALMGSLNPKGEREKALKRQMEKSYNRLCSGLQKRSKYVAHKIAMEDAELRRSTRVRTSRDSPALAFLDYVNKLKDN